MQLTLQEFRNQFYEDIFEQREAFSNDTSMINMITIFAENYKEDNITFSITSAFLAFS